ncbi:hypothetical protein B0H13DRAFT_1886369 [Mycena leptocephala]|nr:hypothetical protein B0H13DRAFT_1886369 [Mycena leptocephala]
MAKEDSTTPVEPAGAEQPDSDQETDSNYNKNDNEWLSPWFYPFSYYLDPDELSDNIPTRIRDRPYNNHPVDSIPTDPSPTVTIPTISRRFGEQNPRSSDRLLLPPIPRGHTDLRQRESGFACHPACVMELFHIVFHLIIPQISSFLPSSMAPNRAASKSISASISILAAHDLDSDDDMDITLVNMLSQEYDNDSEDQSGSDQEEDSKDESGSGSGCGSDQSEDESGSGSGSGSGSDQDEDEEDAEGDEPVVVPAKRKGGPKKKPGPKPMASKPAPASREIEYTTSVYTAEQAQKPRSSRGDPATAFFTLDSDEPWTTLQSKIRNNIRTALELEIVQLTHYRITFTVPRQVKHPIQLHDLTEYKHLVTNALKIKVTPSAKILIEPKVAHHANGKENEDAKGKKGGKKTKIPNERAILPGNVALNAKIGALREKWQCPTPGAVMRIWRAGERRWYCLFLSSDFG